MQTSTLLMHRSLATRVKFRQELKKHQDWDFCIRMDIIGVKFLCLEHPLSVWHVESTQDRVSKYVNPAISRLWISEYRMSIPRRAYWGFNARELATQYADLGWIWRPLYLVSMGFVCGVLPPRLFLRNMAKIIIPSRQYAWLKRRLT